MKVVECTQCGYPNIANAHFKLCGVCNQKRLDKNKEPVMRDVPTKYWGSSIKKGNKNATKNSKYYREFWAQTDEHFCAECGMELLEYDAGYVSHYLPKGAYPALAFDLENAQLHCGRCHSRWDGGDRLGMNSYSEDRYHYLRKKYTTVSKSV